MKKDMRSIWRDLKMYAPTPKQRRNSKPSIGISATLAVSLAAVVFVASA